MFNFGAIGQGVAGTIQSGVGLITAGKGRRERKKAQKQIEDLFNNKEKYKVPDAITDSYDTAVNEANGKPAVQQYMEDSANQNLSNNLSAVRRYATSSSDALAAASGANNQAQGAMINAAQAGAQQRSQNLQNVYANASTLGDYKSMQYDINVQQPFLQRMEFAQGNLAYGRETEQAGMNQFVEGQKAIGDSAANFFGGGGGGGGGGMLGGLM